MDIKFIIIAVVVLAVLLYLKFGKSSEKDAINNQSRPDDSKKSKKLVENDKLVVVKNLKLDYLKKAIEQYCNLSNQDDFVTQAKLIDLSDNFVILFPYDTAFDNFCYFVNYLVNAHELCLLPDYKPDIKAWCTTKPGDEWMTKDLINKKVMIFIPDWDEEHDNVYLTTLDNLGFKMGFAHGEEHQKLDKPVKSYQEPVDFKIPEEAVTID